MSIEEYEISKAIKHLTVPEQEKLVGSGITSTSTGQDEGSRYK